jgi:hypothetical protein
MEWPATLIAAAVAAVLTALFGWAGARAPDPRRGPRIVPYRFLMVLSATVLVLIVVHMVNLAGMMTGR